MGDRTNKDQMMPTWTPASTSLQPRAPGPGHYGDTSQLGNRGKHEKPKYTWGASQRSCLSPNPPQKIEMELQIHNTVGSKHPGKRMGRSWSVYGKDRSQLPYDIST